MSEQRSVPGTQTCPQLSELLHALPDLVSGDLRAHARERPGLADCLERWLQPGLGAEIFSTEPEKPARTWVPEIYEALAQAMEDAPISYLCNWSSGFPPYLKPELAIPELYAAGLPQATVERFAAESAACRRRLLVDDLPFHDAVRCIGEYAESVARLRTLAESTKHVILARTQDAGDGSGDVPGESSLPLARFRPARAASHALRGDAQAPADDMLTTAEVAKIMKVSQRTVARWSLDGTIPPPIKVGGRAVRWPRNVIDQWILNRPPAGGS